MYKRLWACLALYTPPSERTRTGAMGCPFGEGREVGETGAKGVPHHR